MVSAEMIQRLRRLISAGWADSFVGGIDRHKAAMLAGAIFAVALLGVIAIFFALVESDVGGLTTAATEIGGYVAIVGVVLGLPALGYAMVTDRAVERLKDALGGLTEHELESISDQIKAEIHAVLHELGRRLPDRHNLQVFVPNRQRRRLVPIYDPKNAGPDGGWEVDPDAPQAITGSTWVEDAYIYATGPDLHQSGLRLTSEQHKRYGPLTGVAAAPIRRDGEKIGVLTVYTEAEKPQMQDSEFIKLHRKLADSLSPVISRHVPKTGPLKMEPINTLGEAAHHKSGILADEPPLPEAAH
jgi:hypothetical protein